jgi:hypothetical protein
VGSFRLPLALGDRLVLRTILCTHQRSFSAGRANPRTGRCSATDEQKNVRRSNRRLCRSQTLDHRSLSSLLTARPALNAAILNRTGNSVDRFSYAWIWSRETSASGRESKDRNSTSFRCSPFAFRAHSLSYPLAGTRYQVVFVDSRTTFRSSVLVRHCRRRFEIVVDSATHNSIAPLGSPPGPCWYPVDKQKTGLDNQLAALDQKKRPGP